MATKTILIVIADPQAPGEISQALGTEWMPTPVASEAAAVEQLEQYAFDALLVDFNLGSSDASELLAYALAKRPDIMRFLFAYEADLALVAAKVEGEHQLLPKPIDLSSLKSRIEEGVAQKDSSARQSRGTTTGGAVAAPEVPPVYSEVIKLLDSGQATNEQVGNLIAQDASLAAEVLRLTTSGYLGSRPNVSDPAEAVGLLGLQTVRTIVLALRFLAEHRHLRPGYLSLDKVWQHSTRVAQIARDLVLFETRDRALASEAFAGGLVHDLGKVVLANNFDDLYCRVHSLARNQPVALWDVEKEMFGASHGEIGGCLLGMWNLPFSVVEAAASHHEPPTGQGSELTALAAVHIANALEQELEPNEGFRVAAVIDTHLLSELGLLQRLPVWRAALANGSMAMTGMQNAPVEPADTEPVLVELPVQPAPVLNEAPPTPRWESEETAIPSPANWWPRWTYAGIAAGLLLLAFVWLRKETGFDESVQIRGRTAGATPAAVMPSESQQAVPVEVASVEKDVLTAAAAEETDPTPTVAAAEDTQEASVEEAPASAADEATAKTEILTAAAPTEAPPEFRLNGIIYTVARPAALVNGQTVYVGSKVKGATVLAISPSQVTLEVQGLAKTLKLR